MPQVAAWATAALASAIVGGASTAAGAAAATAIASTVVSVGSQFVVAAASAAAGALLAPKQRAEGSSTAFRLVTDAGIPFAFGTVGVGGVLAYRKGFGATNRYQALVSTVCGAGPIKSFVSFAADDEVTTFGVNDVATSGDHSGAMWLQRKLGTQPQAALTSPTGLEGSVTAPGWTSAHDQSGKAVVMWTLFENSKMTEFKGGVPKPLHVIEGKYGWDPRLDSTYSGGSGSCRLLTPSTWVWIENPAIAALNWAIGMWEGDSGGGLYGVPYACSLVGGIGSSLAGIDVPAFVNAANIADANDWIVAAYPTTKDDKYGVLTNLLQAAGAMPSRKAGKISCVSFGEEQTSILNVTAADTAGPVEVSLGQSRLERINTVLPRFYSASHRWEMTQASPVTDSAWLTEDGGKRSRGLDYPYVPDADQAAQLAYYDIANAREAVSGTVTFKPHMRRIEPGDCFTFTEPGFLLDGVKVKCLRRSYDPMTGGVRITFRQETDAKHAAAMGETGTAPDPTVPDTPFPGPWPGDDTVYGPPGSGGGTAGDLAFLDTVAAAQIDTGAVEAAKLADDAVDLAGTKVTGKSLANVDSSAATKLAGIEAGATQNLGALADLNSVGAAQIDSAAVTAAKLGTSAVETAKINAAAVTNSLDVFTASVQTLTTSVQNVQGLTFTTTGNRLIVDFRFYLNIWHPSGGGETCTLVLKRDSTTIWSIALAATGDDFLFGWQSVAVPDTPAAGSYTYQLTAQLTAGTGSVMTTESRFMSVTEYKR
jgi:hypothetical protein